MQEIRLGESPEKSNPWKTCSASFSLCTECLIPDRYPELLPRCVEVTAVAGDFILFFFLQHNAACGIFLNLGTNQGSRTKSTKS